MNNIKVLYDHQVMCSQVYGGIARYFCEVIERLRKQKEFDVAVKCLFNENVYFEKLFGKKAYNHYHWRVGEVIKVLNKIYTKPYIREGFDIIHPTGYDPYIFDIKDDHSKVVVTIHDMIQEIYRDSYYSNDKVIEQKKKQIYLADHIIAVSMNTKNDILNVYPDIPEDKVSVIYHGKSLICRGKDIPQTMNGIPKRYVLYVGSRYHYKNFKNFIRAMQPLLRTDKDIMVVCAGGGAFKDDEKMAIGEQCDRYIQKNVSDTELAYLYTHAMCFVFPSLYEGFGLPTLEAFSYGCPVAVSNTGAMPEVAGKAAVYFDPERTENMTEAISQLLHNDSLREELKKSGFLQAEKYSWEKVAELTGKCYQKVYEGIS